MIRMDEACVHSSPLYVEYLGATLYDMESVMCQAEGTPVKRRVRQCAVCEHGEIGIANTEGSVLYDFFCEKYSR